MKKLITILAALAVSISFATAADAEKKAEKKGGGATAEERFKKLDTNGDGTVSLEEFKAGPAGKKDATKAEEIFKKLNKAGDGKLTLEEYKAGAAGHKKGGDAAPAAPAASTEKPAEKK